MDNVNMIKVYYKLTICGLLFIEKRSTHIYAHRKYGFTIIYVNSRNTFNSFSKKPLTFSACSFDDDQSDEFIWAVRHLPRI